MRRKPIILVRLFKLHVLEFYNFEYSDFAPIGSDFKSNVVEDNCEATYNNKYYGHFGAFSCLIGSNSTAAADVAFVDYRSLMSSNYSNFW